MNWNRNTISCLDTAVREIQNSEQTQEIKVPDGMPDVGKVLSAWGQPILRSKEWETDRISLAAGMMVWVLYQGEDGKTIKCLDAWVPFQLRVDLPEGCQEGEIRARCLTRFVDARSVSPRKLMVRCGLGCFLEAFVPRNLELFAPEGDTGDLQLLQSTYPVCLYQEAGEKTFFFEEELSVPDTMPQPEEVIYYRLCPMVMEKKVLSDKVVFRGNGNLHLFYRGEEGEYQSWDAEVPFSQYAQLDGEYSVDAQADIALCVTDLEVQLDPEGKIRFQGTVTGQYGILDKIPLRITEDAYLPGRALEVNFGELEVPVVLEQRKEIMTARQSIPQEARSMVDVSFLADFPRQRRGEDTVEMIVPGSFQLLSYDAEGNLQGGAARWEGAQSWTADEESRMTAIPLSAEAKAVLGAQVEMRAELPLELMATALQRIPMVTGIAVGDVLEPDPNRPSLLLKRAGEQRLWDIAKAAGSTMEAIRQANGLQQDPEPGRLLLIPVP